MKLKILVFFIMLFLLLAPCSAATPKEVSDAIVDPATQPYIIEVGSTSGNSVQFAVINQSMEGFPTNGSSFAIISSGNATDLSRDEVHGGNSTTTGQYSNRGDDSYDVANFYIKLLIPQGASTLSFDWLFATDEQFTTSSYHDWARVILTCNGVSYNMLLLPDGNPVDVNSSALYRLVPIDTDYNFTTSIYTSTYDVSNFAGQIVELNFWVADENDDEVNTALFVDNLHINVPHNNTTVSAHSVPMQKTGVPVGALLLGALTILGGVFYSKKQ